MADLGEPTELYLSRLALDPRRRAVQRLLADCHALHRAIMTAFPNLEGDDARVRLGVLHRLDVDSRVGSVVLLVQAGVAADWSGWTDERLVGALEQKAIGSAYDRLVAGMDLRFRLRANPTRKIDTRSGPNGEKRNGQRVPVGGTDKQLQWLQRKGEQGGFAVRSASTGAPNDMPRDVVTMPQGQSLGWPAGGGPSAAKRPKLTFEAVRFDGVLRVTDAARFRETLAHGIGSGKAFGFGLLSVGVVR